MEDKKKVVKMAFLFQLEQIDLFRQFFDDGGLLFCVDLWSFIMEMRPTPICDNCNCDITMENILMEYQKYKSFKVGHELYNSSGGIEILENFYIVMIL